MQNAPSMEGFHAGGDRPGQIEKQFRTWRRMALHKFSKGSAGLIELRLAIAWFACCHFQTPLPSNSCVVISLL
jgi:hypothetical protein